MSYSWQNRAHQPLKPQDVLVLLKLIAAEGRLRRLLDVAVELSLSPSEVSMALERARRSGLLDESKRHIRKGAFLEFLLHGLKYVYPADVGAVSRGIPTSHSAAPLSDKLFQAADSNDSYVWPHAEGSFRGQAVSPLCEWAPEAARRDPRLHELLALVDALRVGRAREREMAAAELKQRIYAPQSEY